MLKPKPMLLKISPDIDNNQLDIIIELVMDLKIDGLIAQSKKLVLKRALFWEALIIAYS